MTSEIKEGGGVLVRLFEAINGFHSKFGYWPSKLLIDSDQLGIIVCSSLTPKGFLKLQSKLEIDVSEEVGITLLGRGKDAFHYGREGWSLENKEVNAVEWLEL